ncbi:MFS transporter [Thermoflavimicrobium dichotomicum]|uniref:Major Facilitator Superfamily protein n=1 Tax=Thermoflavimicrobium dichotomicum TaxID=46223 RepID=A0A1I3TGL3_9BACL|nr:MFS transporter [Thermoflavimicrobium dichotomicum]SFJ69770.1 Major Facilitator Superfamily protein [Thermoflavimicrobium dichotomicum]
MNNPRNITNTSSEISLGWRTWLIILIDFIICIIFYMFVPYLASYFNHALGYSTSLIGVILAVRLISQQGLAMIGGSLADQFGYKKIAILGFIIRGVGFAGMGTTTNVTLILLYAFLSGAGGAMFSPVIKILIAVFTPSEKYKESYSLLHMAENAGAILGPTLGLFIHQDQFVVLSLIAGIVFCLIGVSFLFIHDIPSPSKSMSWRKSSIQIIQNPFFLFFTFMMIPYHAIYQQIYISIPLTAERLTGSSGWLFPLMTLMIILFQWPVTQYFKEKSWNQTLFAAYFCLSLTFIVMGMSSKIWSIIFGLAGIAFATMTLLPAYQTYIAKMAAHGSLGAYFGFSYIAAAIGGALGNVLGGMLYSYFSDINKPEWLWTTFALLCLISAFGCIAYRSLSKTPYSDY